MIYVQTKQSVFPKAVYIGDRAELRCSFQSEAVLNAGSVSSEVFADSLDFSVYDIKDISIQVEQQIPSTSANNYTLVISFVPWRTGVIHLPDLEIDGIGTFHFEGIQVLSLVEQQNVSGLRTYSSPLLLPGTAYKIYGGIAVIVILIVLLIRLIVKWRSVVFWFKNTKLQRRYARSRKNTIRALQNCQTSDESDAQLCTHIQKIMREYLELRLDYPFTKTLSSELSLAFEKATYGLADEKRYSAFENIIAVFVRTDFIRFSDSSVACFEKGELEKLISDLIEAIDVIETKPEEKTVEEGGDNA